MASDDHGKLAEPSRLVVDFDLLRKFGGQNLRDLGGHPIAGGRSVRSGRVYRSAHLAEIPEESPLRDIPLRTLVTLQSRVEVRHLGPPEPTLMESVRWEHIPIGDRWFSKGEFTAISRVPGREHLVLVTEFVEAWRAFFTILGEREVYPLLFHCSAGRDRTGVGAAMLLELLGVDRDRIVADFLESNVVFPRALLHAEMLDPIFELIDERGGIDNFMRDVIGLPSATLDVIRTDLLE